MGVKHPNQDEMNGLRADAHDILLKKLRDRFCNVKNFNIRPVIGVIVMHGINLQRIDIEDSEIRVNMSDLDAFMDRQVEMIQDTLLIR